MNCRDCLFIIVSIRLIKKKSKALVSPNDIDYVHAL